MQAFAPKFLIADDHALMRDGMLLMVKNTWPTTSCEVASDYAQVIALLDDGSKTQAPGRLFDVVVLDLRMPGMRGVDSVALVAERANGAKIIVCTALEDPGLAERLMKVGIFSVVSKTLGADELLKHLHLALNALNSPAGRESRKKASSSLLNLPTDQGGSASLTQRQRETLSLLRAGKPTKVIATELGVSVDTVKSHLRDIYTMLKVNSRSEAIVKSQDWLL